MQAASTCNIRGHAATQDYVCLISGSRESMVFVIHGSSAEDARKNAIPYLPENLCIEKVIPLREARKGYFRIATIQDDEKLFFCLSEDFEGFGEEGSDGEVRYSLDDLRKESPLLPLGSFLDFVSGDQPC